MRHVLRHVPVEALGVWRGVVQLGARHGALRRLRKEPVQLGMLRGALRGRGALGSGSGGAGRSGGISMKGGALMSFSTGMLVKVMTICMSSHVTPFMVGVRG